MCSVQSLGLPQVDFEEMIGREMQCKVLEAIEENDRLVLSNRKSAFSQKKLTYTVRLFNPSSSPVASALTLRTYQEGIQRPLGYACLTRIIRVCRTCPSLLKIAACSCCEVKVKQ